MKLSKQATREIGEAIAALNEGIDYIMSSRTIVVMETSVTGFPKDTWTSGDGRAGIAIEKGIGSKLCYIWSARDRLKRLVTPAVVEKEGVL